MQDVEHLTVRRCGADKGDMRWNAFWLKIYAATIALFALMSLSAEALHSYRGEWGLAVGALMLVATLAADYWFFTASWRVSAAELGLGAPRRRGIIAASIVGAVLFVFLFAGATLVNAQLTLRADWLWLVPGLLAQAGLAEELLFRGFVYGRISRDREFWRAVALSVAPFALVHLVLFFTMPWPIALASLALSIVMTPALCQLYELGGRTIWAPAILHAVVQGAIKLFDIGGEGANALPLAWIAGCALAPYIAFTWRRAE